MAREKRGKSGKRKPRRGNRAARPRSTKKPRITPKRSQRVTRKPKPAPKPTVVRKRPAVPKKRKKVAAVVKPALWELRTETKTVYRDLAGKVVPRGTPGAKRSQYTWTKDPRAKRRRLIAKVEPDYTQKTGSVDRDGPDMGRIDLALVKSSATSAYQDAQMIEFTIKATDHRGKDHRFKISMNLGEVRRKRKLHRAVVGRILQELRRRGYRTNYTLDLFKQARLKGLKYRITWQDWRKLNVLHDMEITITVFK
jgi:hypothetical protein